MAAFCLAMAEMMSGFTNVLISSVLFALAAGLGFWYVLTDSPIKLFPAKRSDARMQLAGSSLIVILVYWFAFRILSGHSDFEAAREAEKEGRLAALEKTAELNNSLIHDLAQTVIAKDNPSASNITPLSNLVASQNEGSGAISITSPRPGDELTATVGIVHLRIKVISASKSSWHCLVDELKVGKNIDISGMDFSISPGIPFGLVLGKDFALVASVITLESGTNIAWVGLVPPGLAPNLTVVDARPNSLLPE